jgi:hypothetical protein
MSDRAAAEIEGLALGIESSSWATRIALAAASTAAGAGILWGFAVVEEFHHWVAWTFALLLLEPCGIVALVAAAFFIAPRSRLALWLRGSLPRMKLGLMMAVLALFSFVAGTLGWGLLELWRVQR